MLVLTGTSFCSCVEINDISETLFAGASKCQSNTFQVSNNSQE
jgi:hypothetical protein